MRNRKLVIGLMSGTSADAIDSALVEIQGKGVKLKTRLIAYKEYPFDKKLRETIFSLSNNNKIPVSEISRANFLLGEEFARAAKKLAREAGISMSKVSLIGSHGQTICHIPKKGITFQIGEPSVIAERTGITTVADFRVRDIACGGEGAPLVPYVDYVLFRDKKSSRGFLNIGGIANITVIPKNCRIEDVIAFDTGPGNMVVDYLSQVLGFGKCDVNGKFSGRGKINKDWIRKLLKHPFILKKPPKSAGREIFGEYFSKKFAEEGFRRGMCKEDILATACAFTAKSVKENYKRFIESKCSLDELFVSGGGVKNNTIFKELKKEFFPVPVKKFNLLGIPSPAKEAVAFAVLAHETMCGNQTNLPQVTGAKGKRILGKIVPA